MRSLHIAAACLLAATACTRPDTHPAASAESPAAGAEPRRMLELDAPVDELPPGFGPPEPVLACILDQLARSTPALRAPHPVWTAAEAFGMLKDLRPDRVYKDWTEAGGYFIFADAQVGSSKVTGSPYPYGLAFKKGDTAAYKWCHWGPEYVRYIKNGATVADNFVCILDLAEWNWRQRRSGSPKCLNGATLPAGTSFHIEARIVNLIDNQRNLSFGDWAGYDFLPRLDLYRLDESALVPHELVPVSSKRDSSAWGGDLTRTTYDVPDNAYGDYHALLASLPPGVYRIVVCVDFVNGTLRSNPQEFTAAANP